MYAVYYYDNGWQLMSGDWAGSVVGDAINAPPGAWRLTFSDFFCSQSITLNGPNVIEAQGFLLQIEEI